MGNDGAKSVGLEQATVTLEESIAGVTDIVSTRFQPSVQRPCGLQDP